MDFKQIGDRLTSDEATPLHVKAPNGQPFYRDSKDNITVKPTDNPVRVFVIGQDSKGFRERKIEFATALAKGTAGSSATVIAIAGAVTGWENVVYDGKPMEFSPENAALLLESYPPLTDQISAFIANRANFFDPA